MQISTNKNVICKTFEKKTRKIQQNWTKADQGNNVVSIIYSKKKKKTSSSLAKDNRHDYHSNAADVGSNIFALVHDRYTIKCSLPYRNDARMHEYALTAHYPG